MIDMTPLHADCYMGPLDAGYWLTPGVRSWDCPSLLVFRRDDVLVEIFPLSQSFVDYVDDRAELPDTNDEEVVSGATDD